MGFLRSLGVGFVVACAVVFFSHQAVDGFAAGVYGEFGEVYGVGTHVGYLSGLVEFLGDAHGPRDAEAQFPRGLLLEGGGGEGGRGRLAQGFARHVFDGEAVSYAAFEEGLRLVAGGEACVQVGAQFTPVGFEQRGGDAEEALALELLYFALAFYDEAHGHGLHSSGGEGGFHLSPQHGGELEAYDAVEHAPRLLGIDQVDVYFPRVLDGLEYGGLGDFMKDYPLAALGFQAEHFIKVPGDGLSFAVLIGCEPDGAGLLGGLLQLAD